MTVYKKSQTVKEDMDKIVIGTYVPRSLVQYLKLYALDRGLSYSVIIREQMTNFKESQEELGLELDNLLDSLRDKALLEFEERKESGTGITMKEFKEELQEELEKTKISSILIKKLLTNIGLEFSKRK
jgi:hypothetical protein